MDRYGLSPNVWGPSFWKIIHFSTIGFPNKPNNHDNVKFINFMDSLIFLLPCVVCREHLSENLAKSPPVLNSRDTLIMWGYNLHNTVNKMLEKKEYKFKNFLIEYDLEYKNNKFQLNPYPKNKKCNNSGLKISGILIGIIIIILLACIIFFQNSNNKRYSYKK